jgi:hypothetical protein
MTTMKIDQKTQAKIAELRRLAALPPPEPSDRFTQRIINAFFRGLRRDADLEQIRKDFSTTSRRQP